MDNYRKDTQQGMSLPDPCTDNEVRDSRTPQGTPAQVFEERARRIKRSYGALPAVARPETIAFEAPATTVVPRPEEIDFAVPVDKSSISAVRKKSSSGLMAAVKTVVDLEVRFMPIRKAVDDILRPLSIIASNDNGLKFHKVYLELCAEHENFPELLAEWLNDRIVRMKVPGVENHQRFIILNTSTSDLDAMFPIVNLQKISELGNPDSKPDKVPLMNVLPDLQY